MSQPARSQTDFLDFVIDNAATRRREVYRNGELCVASANVEHPLLKHYSATGPWGTYPGHPPTQPPA